MQRDLVLRASNGDHDAFGLRLVPPFTFDITVGAQAPSTITVAAGDCSVVGTVLDGTSVHVAEVLDSSFRIFSVACNPGARTSTSAPGPPI